MERPEPRINSNEHAVHIEAVNFAEKPPEFGQPVVLFFDDTDNIDETGHLIPVTIGCSLGYDNSILTLETPFSDQPGAYAVDDYIAVAGADLEELIRVSSHQAHSDNPYLRANAVMMSGIASLLDIDSDYEAIATQCIDWTVAHEGLIDHEEMVAILYAYTTTMQEQYVEVAVRERLAQGLTLEQTLRHGSMTAAYVTVMTDHDASALQQLAVLSDLLKKT